MIITPNGCEGIKLGTPYKKNTGKKTKNHIQAWQEDQHLNYWLRKDYLF